MSVTQQTQQSNQHKSEGIDISSMLNDVNKVLHSHLTNILTPMIQEKNSIRSILLNMPMVKKLQEEHLRAQQTVFIIQAETKALKLFYHGEIESKNEELSKLKNEELTLTGKIEHLDHKNILLSTNLDLDYVETLIRQRFLFGRKDETIYIIKKNDN